MSVENKVMLRVGFWLDKNEIQQKYPAKDIDASFLALYDETGLKVDDFGNCYEGCTEQFFSYDLRKTTQTKEYSECISCKRIEEINNSLKKTGDYLKSKGLTVSEPVVTALLLVF